MRLIDADVLEAALHNFFDGKVIDEPAYILRDVFCHIDGAPTVELDESVIQEVLKKRCMTAVTNEYLIALHGKGSQGEWEVFYTPKMKKVFRCNKCQAVSIQGKTKFCYNCGILMKGGTE